ncbi:MAG: RDD family protein, partial [Brachymonas sp.]
MTVSESTIAAEQASTTPLSPQFPSLRRRMACWLYEGVLMFGVVWIAGYLFGTLSQTRNALDNRFGLQIFLFVIFGIYFVW